MSKIYILILCFVLFIGLNGKAQQRENETGSVPSGRFTAGALIGPSLLIEKAPDSINPEIRDYLNKLRSGWHYGLETEYFFNDYFGVGATYTSFNTKQQVDSIVFEFFSRIFYINLSSTMKINSVSPMIYGRLPLAGNKLEVKAGIGPSWLFYRNIGKALADSALFKGSSPGLSTSLSLNYQLIPNLSIGIKGSYMEAFLKEFTKNDGITKEVIKLEKADYQNLSRIDFSFGIFYTLHCK